MCAPVARAATVRLVAAARPCCCQAVRQQQQNSGEASPDRRQALLLGSALTAGLLAGARDAVVEIKALLAGAAGRSHADQQRADATAAAPAKITMVLRTPSN